MTDMSHDIGPCADCLCKRDIEVAADHVRIAAVDYPLLAVSLHQHFRAVGQF